MKYLLSLFFAILTCSIFITFTSCEPMTIIETEIITVTDTLVVNTTDTLIVTALDTILIQDESTLTCFILVKHAEKGTDGTDPDLTTEGMERAERLAFILSQMNLDKIYSTDYKRTMQTAMPTADNQDLNITEYGGFDHIAVISDFLEDNNQGKVLIVGHSNTTPNFLNTLTGTSDYDDIDEDTFDDLFIVKTKEKGDSEVVHLKY